jgi:SAM-dependent methyltransferase
MSPLKEHWLVYEGVQEVAGRRLVNRRVRTFFATVASAGPLVLDVGGGTGDAAGLWPAGTTYCCLEPDLAKLRGFRRRHPRGLGVQADGLRAPAREGAVDVVMCKDMSHHLDDQALDGLLREAARVAKPDGRFVFMDAVRCRRPTGRLLWKIDRGSNPRTVDELTSAIASSFTILETHRFAVLHEYLLCIARPRRPVHSAGHGQPILGD